ncbi:MAG: glutathione-disulfide reductase [Elainellaceae cyanobacterium]
MVFDYDFFVIGAGSGGLAAAKRAAAWGANVAIAEDNKVGGVCVNRGCIPKKLLLYASKFSSLMQAANDYGWRYGDLQENSTFDWSSFIAAKNQEIQRLQHIHEKKLNDANVTFLPNRVSFVDDHTLRIDDSQGRDRTVTADKILIATGSIPWKPSIPGIEYALTSREMFYLPEQPRRIAIIGGGYIGVEFAGMMNGLGSHVCQLVREPCILQRFDDEVSRLVLDGMIARGIDSRCRVYVKNIEKAEGGLEVYVSDPDGNSLATIEVDIVLAATGRMPNTDGLALENAGVEFSSNHSPHAGAIQVDEYHRTSQPHIFAIGDCIDRVNLTPVAVAAGRSVADTEFGDRRVHTMRYDSIPTAVFSQPEAAMIGMTEAQARDQIGDAVQCYTARFQPLFYNLTQHNETALCKLVVDSTSNRVLGAHMVGDHAAEIIQGVAIAVTTGITKQDFEATIGIHPTSAEEFVSL